MPDFYYYDGVRKTDPGTKLSDMDGLSNRAVNCLNRGGIFTLNDLMCSRSEYLLSIRGLGIKSLDEIMGFASRFNEVVSGDFKGG